MVRVQQRFQSRFLVNERFSSFITQTTFEFTLGRNPSPSMSSALKSLTTSASCSPSPPDGWCNCCISMRRFFFSFSPSSVTLSGSYRCHRALTSQCVFLRVFLTCCRLFCAHLRAFSLAHHRHHHLHVNFRLVTLIEVSMCNLNLDQKPKEDVFSAAFCVTVH